MSIIPGQIIAYREKGKLLLGAILKDKDKKVYIISEKNDKGNIPKERIKHLLKTIPETLKNYEIIKEIQKIKKEIEEISKTIKLDELHSLLCEEEQGFSYQELADLYFEDGSKLQYILSMGLALSSDTLYFKLKNETYYTRNKKQIEKELKEKETEKLNKIKKEKERKESLLWIKRFINSSYDKKLLPPPNSVLKLLEPLKQYVILKDDFNNKELIKKITTELREKENIKVNNNIQELFGFLTKFEIIKEDHIILAKYNILKQFNEKIIKEAKEIKDFKKGENNCIRKDLTKIFTFTIDDIETNDIDDAISLELLENEYKLGIHITDVDYFIKEGSLLDKEAKSRRMSIYLPNTKIPMLPRILSEDKLSLIEGKLCPALSFIVSFSKDFKILKKEIMRSIIKIDKNMTYKEVGEIFDRQNDEIFTTLHKIAKSLNETREKNGAIEFTNPDIKIKLDENKNITLNKVNRNLISDLIIKESMILANYITAELCVSNNIPAIYFYQEAPNEAIVLNDDIRDNKYLLIEEMKKMKRSEVSSYPHSHFALGLPYYIQATSPIRRYHDLIIHRQIKKYLRKKDMFYSKEEVEKVAFTTEERAREIRNIERESLRYWTLKYLKQEKKKNAKFRATVLKRLIASYLVEIEEVITTAILITPNHIELGRKVGVTISKVNALLDKVEVKLLTHNNKTTSD